MSSNKKYKGCEYGWVMFVKVNREVVVFVFDLGIVWF